MFQKMLPLKQDGNLAFIHDYAMNNTESLYANLPPYCIFESI